MPAHTHDGIDWVARLADLRRADEANGPAQRAVATRLIESLPAPQPIVLDVGCGAGGMSAALAEALVGRAANSGDAFRSAEPPEPAEAAEPSGPAEPPEPAELSELSELAKLAEPPRPAELPEPAKAAEPAELPQSVGAVGPPRSAEPPESAEAVEPDGGVGREGQKAGGGTLVLVDAVPELLTAAAEAARTAPGAAGVVDVRTVRADLAAVGQLASPSSASARSRDIGAHAHRHAGASADRLADPAASGPFRLRASTRGESDADLPDGVPAADLVWASNVVHHLPDQRRMVTALASWLAPGGCLALAEGGLSMKCLPWDIGIGEPGLQDRLIAAHGMWFHGMRTGISGSVRLPIGWNLVLAEAGLTGVTAFSYLIDVPAPLGDTGRAAVVSWLGWLARVTSGLLSADDVAVLDRLLDPDDAAYVGGRDDVFLLKASTVHLGWRK